jgi:O-antigen/teichoic acid export membrane protein
MGNESGQRSVVRYAFLNSLSNYVGQFFKMGAWLVLTPFILNQLGDTMFGLWVLVGSVVAYGFLLDFGIAGAITKYTAEFRAKKAGEEARSLIATALWLYTGLGLFVILISLVIAPLFPVIFNVADAERETAIWLVLLSGIGVGITILCTTTTAVLRGLQRFDLINLIGVSATLVSAGATVIVLLLGGGAIGLVVVGIAVTLFTQIPNVWFIYRIAPELRFGWRGANRTLLRTVASYSSSIFVMNVGGYLESKTDEMVIGGFLPVSTVTPYNLARRLSLLPQTLAEQFLMLLLPMASEIYAKNDLGQLRFLYIVSTRITLAVALPTGLTLIFLAQNILTVWVGVEYASYAYLVVMLTVAAIIDTTQWPAGLVLQGIARHSPLATMSIAAGVANLILSIMLVNYIGLTGVALGTLIPTIVICIGFVAPYAMRIIGVSGQDMFTQILWPALLPALPMSIVMLALREILQPISIFSLLLVAGIGILPYPASYLLMKANEHERTIFFKNMGRIIHQMRLYLKRIRTRV